MYALAAARTAVGAADSDTSVHAASYETAADCDCSSWNTTLMKRDFCAGSERHTLRVSSRMTS